MDWQSFECELGPNAGRETTELGQGGPISGFPAVTCSVKEALTAISTGSRNTVTASQMSRGGRPKVEVDR
jgi:hypothetical protein